MSSRMGKSTQQASLAVTPPPGQVTRLVTAAKGPVSANDTQVEKLEVLTAGGCGQGDE